MPKSEGTVVIGVRSKDTLVIHEPSEERLNQLMSVLNALATTHSVVYVGPDRFVPQTSKEDAAYWMRVMRSVNQAKALTNGSEEPGAAAPPEAYNACSHCNRPESLVKEEGCYKWCCPGVFKGRVNK